MPNIKKANKKYTIYTLLLLFFSLIIIWMLMPSPVIVDTEKVKYGKYTQYIEEDAKTRATEIYTINSPVKAKLLRIPFLEGDKVSKGQTIAVLMPARPSLLDVRTEEELKQQLGTAKAAYDQAKAELEHATLELKTALSDLNRKKPLVAKGYVTKSDFEHLELEYNLRNKELHIAEKKINAAKYKIDKIKTSLANFTALKGKSSKKIEIPSPTNGKILRIFLKSESTINMGTTIMEVADVNDLEVLADILSNDAAQIPPNAKVIIHRWGGKIPLDGKVRTIEPSAFTKTSALGVEEQRVNVVIDITTPNKTWKNLGDAFRVHVKIILFESDHALLVPMSAVFRDKQDWAVYLVKNNKAKKRTIKIKWHNPDYAVIESGLTNGDTVILFPSSAIYDGAKIKLS